jgi:uncharacterized protein YabE (DUF348 family)
LYWLYHATGQPLLLNIDGDTRQVSTHQKTVAGLLAEQQLELGPGDEVYPHPDDALANVRHVTLSRAMTCQVEIDGQVQDLHVQPDESLQALLASAGVTLHPRDRVSVNGQAVSPTANLGQVAAGPTTIQVERAVPFILHDDGAETTLHTTAHSLGEALWQSDVTTYLGDVVDPPLDTPLHAGMHVYLKRSIPIMLVTDAWTIKTRTRGQTVAEALAQEGIHLAGKDHTSPSPKATVTKNQTIYVSRIAEEWTTESEMIPYETVWSADPNLEIDHQRVSQVGRKGIRKRRYHITYENGHQVARVLDEEWIEQEPEARIISYGTKIVLREIETEKGVKRYWRKLRILATSYTAATSGKTRDHPLFGITRMGWRARKGIIAVDPDVIPLTTNMYVPGYGVGVAGDTGGAINGRRIDLCYDEHNLVLWYKWVDVYLLEPVPPRDEINWTLPNWPQER